MIMMTNTTMFLMATILLFMLLPFLVTFPLGIPTLTLVDPLGLMSFVALMVVAVAMTMAVVIAVAMTMTMAAVIAVAMAVAVVVTVAVTAIVTIAIARVMAMSMVVMVRVRRMVLFIGATMPSTGFLWHVGTIA